MDKKDLLNALYRINMDMDELQDLASDLVSRIDSLYNKLNNEDKAESV
jgi:predicted ATP-grasp superfamily ATP-dependent carboligase